MSLFIWREDDLVHFLLLITQYHRLGKLERNEIFLCLWLWIKVNGSHLVMILQVESCSGTWHHMMRQGTCEKPNQINPFRMTVPCLHFGPTLSYLIMGITLQHEFQKR